MTFEQKFDIERLTLFELTAWRISVRPVQVTIGSLVLSLKRTCGSLGQLLPEETVELAVAFEKIESTLSAAFSYSRINYLALMMVDEQVHFHVLPRYKNGVWLDGVLYEDMAYPGPPDLSNPIEQPELASIVLNELRTVIG